MTYRTTLDHVAILNFSTLEKHKIYNFGFTLKNNLFLIEVQWLIPKKSWIRISIDTFAGCILKDNWLACMHIVLTSNVYI